MGAVRRAKLDVRGVSLDLYNERTGRSLPVLRDLDLAVFDGELVSIVGPSGCGKSTFLNAVDGLGEDVGLSGSRLEAQSPEDADPRHDDMEQEVGRRRCRGREPARRDRPGTTPDSCV